MVNFRCNVGDPVLVVWDDQKKNYTILQDSDTLHFVHPVSLDLLRLRPASGKFNFLSFDSRRRLKVHPLTVSYVCSSFTDGSPRKLYCPAEVTEKEYCASKRVSAKAVIIT